MQFLRRSGHRQLSIPDLPLDTNVSRGFSLGVGFPIIAFYHILLYTGVVTVVAIYIHLSFSYCELTKLL